jgi:dephospho-CoA kinase
MRVIVVTGGLGSGKSTAAEYFRTRGAFTLDLDDVAAKLLGPGSALLKRVAGEFGGDEILLADGHLDRPALARIAFSSDENARKLNAIVHPAVIGEIAVAIEQLRLMTEPPSALVLEVPLLAEAPALGELAEVVLAIVAPENTRISRAPGRGLTEDEARRRMLRQASDSQRAELADVVIVNDGPREQYLAALKAFWDEHAAPPGEGR